MSDTDTTASTTDTPSTAIVLAAPIAPPQARLVAFARTPDEMVAAQASLVAWADAKITRERADEKELGDNYRLAVERKWKHSTLKRHWERAKERVTFWEKTRDALAAGYCMVPDLPVDVFAVRTTETRPSTTGFERTSEFGHPSPPDLTPEAPSAAPSGEGKYVSPTPESYTHPSERQSGGKTLKVMTREPIRHGDVDFPFVLAKTQVLDAAAQAMAHRIFDDMGVLPGAAHRAGPRPSVLPDPLVIGRVILPKSHGMPERRLCFVVAWFIDVRDLDAIR